MPINRRRGTNKVRLSLVTRGMAVAAVLGAVGLSYVYMKNKLHQYGEERRKLEHRLAGVRREIKLAEVQVAEWGSRAVLQRRLQDGFVRLQPIAEDRIVRLSAPSALPGAAEEVRPVSAGGKEGIR